MYPQGQIYSPEGATTGTIESASQNSAALLSPDLVELRGPSSSSSSAEERRVYARWSNDEEKNVAEIMGLKF